MIRDKQWVVAFQAWLEKNNMTRCPEKVLVYLDDAIYESLMRKVLEQRTKIENLEAHRKELLEMVDTVTMKMVELRQKVTFLEKKLPESYPKVT